jgi:dihydrofolate reductase
MYNNRQVILYIAMSLDGYIAKPNDDLDFLRTVEQEGEDYGYADFVSTVDTVIVGRKTYDWVMKHVDVFPHADKNTYVITRSTRPAIGNTVFYNGDLTDLVKELKSKKGKNVFCDGGAEIVNELLSHDLLDEIIISVIPIMLGTGTKLFKDDRPEQHIKLVEAKAYQTGLVQLYYKRANKV